MTDINTENALWKETLRKIALSTEGELFFTTLLTNLGYFSTIFTTGAAIYKNAALADFAKWLETELDEIDSTIIQKIKINYKNMLTEQNQKYTRSNINE